MTSSDREAFRRVGVWRFRRVGVGVGAKGPFATKWLNRIAQGFTPAFGSYRERALKKRPRRIAFAQGFAKS
jgi:hypothetical protein